MLQLKFRFGDDEATVDSIIGVADHLVHQRDLLILSPDENIVKQQPAPRSWVYSDFFSPHSKVEEGISEKKAVLFVGPQKKEAVVIAAEFVNDMVVGDEVEVKNTPETLVVSATIPPIKWDPFICQDNLINANSSDTSSENLHLSPDLGSNCSNSPFLSDSGVCSSGSDPSPNKKSKKSPAERQDPIEVPKRIPSPEDSSVTPVSDSTTNPVNRVHYVLQRGQTFIFQTDRPAGLNASQRCKTGSAAVSLPSRIVEGVGDFIRTKPFLQKSGQPPQICPPTSSGSQSSSDTDTGDPVTRGIEAPQYASSGVGESVGVHGGNTGRPNVLTRLNNSAIRLNPGLYAGRYATASCIKKQAGDSMDSFGVNGDFRDTSVYGVGAGGCSMAQSGLLLLTEEEKRTLIAEGYPVPTRLPLSKQEERNLKKIRRKIKNKISAQESRRKKKEYVETLEKRVEVYAQENSELKRRIDGLEGTNRSLLSQLRHLQQLVNKSNTNGNSGLSNCSSSGGTSGNTVNNTGGNSSNPNKRSASTAFDSHASSGSGSRSGTTSTCLMVFLLSFAALFAGQPSGDSTSTASSLRFYSSPSDSSLGDISTFGSLHQIGYTWSGKTGLPGDAETSSLSPETKGRIRASRLRALERQRWRQGLLKRDFHSSPELFNGKSVTRSRILGSSKELEECEPLTWWEYFFGPTSQARDETVRTADGKTGTSLFSPSFSFNTTRIHKAAMSMTVNQTMRTVLLESSITPPLDLMLMNNPRSNRPEWRTTLAARELACYKVDFAALSASRFSEQRKVGEVGAAYICRSCRSRAERRDASVALAIWNDIVGRLPCLPEGINDRLMSLRLLLQEDKFAIIVSVNLPPMTGPDAAINKF
ncbi:Cyclic AMP-responsive element-binding protein 3-like protein [Sparganum proliferum]